MLANLNLSGRKLWLIMAVVVLLGLVLLLAAGGGSDPDRGSGPGQSEEVESQTPGRVGITADDPAHIAIAKWEPQDLGRTPTYFDPPEAGYWNITAYNPESGQQQEVTKRLEPDVGQTIGFKFANAWDWSAPLVDRVGVVGGAWVENEVLRGISRDGPLHSSASPTDELKILSGPEQSVTTVVWRDRQTYLYLTRGGLLVFVSPTDSWQIEGVDLLAGDQNRAGWVKTNGEIWLFDWASQNQSLLDNISGQETHGLFVGEELLYLFKGHAGDEVGADQTHPDGHGHLDIYRQNGTSLGQVDLLSQPLSMVELGNYSFWEVSGELYVINGPKATVDLSWGFSRELVDLLLGTGPDGQPLLYLLTVDGAIWDFDPGRQTYNLVGQAVPEDYQPGRAVFGSLAQDDDYLYFGFLFGDLFKEERTFRVRLTTP